MATKTKAKKGNNKMPATKKQSKANKVLNWLNPTSPAKSMLLFALAFAIVGGGYMAYRSFAASNPPLVFTTLTIDESSPYGSVQQIRSIGADGTGNTLLTSASSTPTSGTSASDGQYSPNHNFVAWTEFTNGNPTGAVKVLDTSNATSKSSWRNKSFTMLANESAHVNHLAKPFVWYPDSRSIAFASQNDINNTRTLQKLDITTGAMTKIADIGSNPNYGNGPDVSSYAVLGDGQTVVYLSGSGDVMKSAKPGSPPAGLSLPTSASNCGNVRARPNTTRQFSYFCQIDGSETKIFRQVPGGRPVALVAMANFKSPTASSTYLEAFEWSPNGIKMGLSLTDVYRTSPEECGSIDIQTRITSVDFTTGSSILTDIATTPKVGGSSCKGAHGNDGSIIAWSQDNQFIAYMSNVTIMTPYYQATDIYRVSTTTPYSAQQLINVPAPTGVSSLSW